MMKKILTGIALNVFVCSVQAVDIHKDKALDEELAYLHAENYVYSAGKKLQKVNDVAAAVFVISKEEIRRSGATNLPDTLRLVPGVQVAQIDASKWAISVRGLNARFSTELLVLIDGRAVYTPVFSGVFWHREDTPLEDIERIEVMRGAGAAMWGANAVNGVINIITKNAKDTQGGRISVGGGNQEQAFAYLRYGGKLGDDFYYRVYGKGFKRNHNVTINRENPADDTENYQGGFKTHWQLTEKDVLTTQGDVYHSRTGDTQDFALTYSPYILLKQDVPGKYKGGNIQSRWQHTFSDTSNMALQVYYKHDDNTRQLVNMVTEHEKTVDIDFQHRFKWLDNHDMIWGLGYRNFDYKTPQRNNPKAAPPPHVNLSLFSGFIQDDITLIKNTLKLTIGTRLEHNHYTGLEVQPNIRLLWTINGQHSVWGAISRAVRTPNISNRVKTSFTNTLPPVDGLPMMSSVDGTPNFKSENVLDYELGYRFQPNEQLSMDLSGFYNKYNRIQGIDVLDAEFVATADGGYLNVPINLVNKFKGDTLGLELSGQWQPVEWLKLRSSYSLVKDNVYENAARQQVNFKASFTLPFNIEIDPMLRYVDSVNKDNPPAYVAFDLRTAWKPMQNLELSLVGQNLFDNQHPEFYDNVFEIRQTQIRRSILGKVSVSF